MSAPPNQRGQVIPLAPRQHARGFTPRDLLDLSHWANDGCRFAFCDSDLGSFAMLYAQPTPWASFAVAREHGAVRLWNCVTLADIGVFACMRDALATVSREPSQAGPTINVLPFRNVRLPERDVTA